MDDNLKIWQYKHLAITYQDHLDGDGRSMADKFVGLIKEKYPERIPFECCYEWCSGPGFMGFALLASGVCNRLVLADINPSAVALARITVKDNGLENQVAVYQSDNLDSINPDEKFDLVVSNPPNFFCLNPQHPLYGTFLGDLRPNDPEWALHKAFYQSIASFLNDDAVLCIEEVDPYAVKCYMPNPGEGVPLWGPEPFDIRPRVPMLDFREMIIKGGLIFDETVQLEEKSVPIHVLISHYKVAGAGAHLTRLPGIVFVEQIGQVADNTYRLHALEGGELKGHVDLAEEQLWLIDMIELLVKSGDQGMSLNELSSQLNQDINPINSASDMLKHMLWAC